MALFLLLALGWSPSLTSLLLLIGAILMLPIKPFDDALRKIKLFPVVRVIIAVELFFVAAFVSPAMSPATTERVAREQAESESDAEEDEEDDEDDDEDIDEYEEEEYVALDYIIGTWKYSDYDDMPITYEFFEDGTWTMSSEGGDDDQGTYEMVDEAFLELTGGYVDHTLRIFDEELLIDENEYEIVPAL